MSTYNSIAWLPLCAGLTGLGLVASWFVFRRRGPGSGLRGVAWSLLPLAAYLTGSIEMFWKIGTAIGNFAAHLVLSPKVWSGVGVAALAAVLFIASAPAKRRRRRLRKHGGDDTAPAATEPGTQRLAVPGQAAANANGNGNGRKQLEPSQSRPARKAKSPEPDDDMREIEEILRRRGIN